ncbi:hypothetical protein Dimus_019983 [Dionaea muscipula]
MATLSGASEIEELGEGLRMDKKFGSKWISNLGRVHCVEDDINQLFKAIHFQTSLRGEGPRKNPSKRLVRASPCRSSGIGISESINLKQALRGLCISQASEMAAIKRRLLKQPGLSGVPVAGGTSCLQSTVIAEVDESGLPFDEGKKSFLEICTPGKTMPDLFKEIPRSDGLVVVTKAKEKMVRLPPPDGIVPFPSKVRSDMINIKVEQKEMTEIEQSLRVMCTIRNDLEGNDIAPPIVDIASKCTQQDMRWNDNKTNKSSSCSPRLLNPLVRNRLFVKRKTKMDFTLASEASNDTRADSNSNLDSNSCKLMCVDGIITSKGGASQERKKPPSAFNGKNPRTDANSSVAESCVCQAVCKKSSAAPTSSIHKACEKSRSGEKGENSQSSKSSLGDYSSGTSSSGESSVNGSTRCGSRPHMSRDLRWEALRLVQKEHGSLSFRHFNLLKKLGFGDIGTVYLAELVNRNCLFALKVMDNEFLAHRKKFPRAQTEREILQMLDHPFLPTLYAHFIMDRFSCLVMEYCPGGDLHVVRQKQPNGSFSEQAARFYVTEVLLALEYLHMLGVVYRDLKPENILVREDGHIMLSDFDLSLRCVANPTLMRSSSSILEPVSSPSDLSCMEPFCLQSSCHAPCFSPRLHLPTSVSKTRKLKADQGAQVTPLPQLVVEPTDARSNSFVGTHEYLAPEIIKGEGHGSAVDWWTFGILLYELLYGKTPFKGSSNDETLANVVSEPLKFPTIPVVSFHARDLIRGLLIKDPENRLGSKKGAVEIKRHRFFEGLNWALIRSAVPPERPSIPDVEPGIASNTTLGENENPKPLEYGGSELIQIDLF